MSEKRKPETVIWVRQGKGRSVKIEVFEGGTFPFQEFEDRQGHAIPPNNIAFYYRLRVRGVWFPPGRKRLYTKNQCAGLIKDQVFK